MKRLKYILLAMDDRTTTYKELYEGHLYVIPPQQGCMPWDEYDPTYYHETIAFHFSKTHKLAQDKPTVTVSIPCEKLGLVTVDNCLRDVTADFCLREFAHYIEELNAELYNRSRPDNENGKYYLHIPGGEILKRNSAYFSYNMQRDYSYGTGTTVYSIEDNMERPPLLCLCLKLQIQLPAKKLKKTVQMLCRDLPDAVDRFIKDFDIEKLLCAWNLAKKQTDIRSWLSTSSYCAFIANGSILPRAKGTDLPIQNAIPFLSTPQDEVEVCGIKGMGIRKGVTVITGGGYSGKSTLLDAISTGIYNHVAGDGRELCITDASAVTISAEDGRSVSNVNISPFIKWLPGGTPTTFSTTHASGSTSQAANIMEAIDHHSKLLLIDEDRSATNFMIRDDMMKDLIEKEPITPFTDRVNELYDTLGISTILVIGGSGEYLSVADKIYLMEDYHILNVTEKAKEISLQRQTTPSHTTPTANWCQTRRLSSEGFTSYPEGSGGERLSISDMGFILIGDEKIDIRGLHDLISTQQINALGFLLRYLEINNSEGIVPCSAAINRLYDKIEKEGLDFLYSSYFTTCERFLELPRKQELLALISRMRHTQYI